MTIKIHEPHEEYELTLTLTASSEPALGLAHAIDNLIQGHRNALDDTVDTLDFKLTRRRFDRITLEPPY